MSDQTPFPTPMPPPALKARINPPSEVSTKIAAAKDACAAWPETVIDSGHPLTFTPEASLCEQLTGETDPAATALHVGIGAGVSGTLMAIAVFIILRRLYRGLRRLADRLLRRPAT